MPLPCQRCCIRKLWYRSVSKYNWCNHYLLLDRVAQVRSGQSILYVRNAYISIHYSVVVYGV